MTDPTSARDLFDSASQRDAAGDERGAIPLYRAALDRGLEEPERTRAIIQLASSLRVVGDPSGAIALLQDLRGEDPLSRAAQAFLSLALFDDGKPAAALRTAVGALLPTLSDYRASLSAYTEQLGAPHRVRAIVVGLVVVDGWLLAEEYAANGRHDGFLRAPGGGIEFGESVHTALRREFAEELDADVREARLLGVTENVFDAHGARGHEIVHVFSVDSERLAAMPRDAHEPVRDSDTTVGWYRLEAVRSGKHVFYPPGALDLLPA